MDFRICIGDVYFETFTCNCESEVKEYIINKFSDSGIMVNYEQVK